MRPRASSAKQGRAGCPRSPLLGAAGPRGPPPPRSFFPNAIKRPARIGALLKGLVRCAACGCAMTPAHSTRNRTKRYRYYVCTGAQKRGWDTCPSKSVPAAELEQFVIDRLRGVGKEPALLQGTV